MTTLAYTLYMSRLATSEMHDAMVAGRKGNPHLTSLLRGKTHIEVLCLVLAGRLLKCMRTASLMVNVGSPLPSVSVLWDDAGLHSLHKPNQPLV